MSRCLSTDWNNVSARTGSEVSVGAGIAIFGAWIGGAATTIFILLIIFVWSNPATKQAQELDWFGGIVLILLIAAPLIAAYSITKVILNKDD